MLASACGELWDKGGMCVCVRVCVCIVKGRFCASICVMGCGIKKEAYACVCVCMYECVCVCVCQGCGHVRVNGRQLDTELIFCVHDLC